MKLSKILTTGLALTAITFSSVSTAAFISGNVNFGGDATVLDDGVSATGISWHDVNPFFEAGNQAYITSATGDLAGLSFFSSTATLLDLDFATLPSINLWSAGGFTFTLESLSVDTDVLGFELDLSGTGILSHLGFDDTEYNWDFSSQSGLSFSSNASAVPEPSIVALLGLGLVGMGVATRRKQKAA